jgi:hypothetical protein
MAGNSEGARNNMAESSLEAIANATVAELLNVPGLSAKHVAFSKGMQFDEGPDGLAVLTAHEPPDSYPGAVLMINDRSLSVSVQAQSYGSTVTHFRVPVTIVFYATSNGANVLAAVNEAWKYFELSLRRLSVFTPQELPAGAKATAPLKPDDATSVTIDANTHAIAAVFWSEFVIEATTT